MKITEFEIREKLAVNLDLLDPNLVLVKQEYAIILPDGRKGFVDILARDKFGCFTIIEIKKAIKLLVVRSNSYINMLLF